VTIEAFILSLRIQFSDNQSNKEKKIVIAIIKTASLAAIG
jgi:hypothetical protein